MHPEQKFRLLQERAYEIYQQRDPNNGTAEEDGKKQKPKLSGKSMSVRDT